MGRRRKVKKKHLNTEQVEYINTTLSFLESAFESTFSNLTGDERKKYGNICAQQKLLINKVGEFAANKPDMRNPDVNWDEFAKDFTSRAVLEEFIERLQKLLDGFGNAKCQYDYDNYTAALADYTYADRYRYKEKKDALKELFCRMNKSL
jgi:hypothetical protein